MGMYGITKAHRTDVRETPASVFEPLNREFGFTLDVCATPMNAKCADYFTEEFDALERPWCGRCWMNPPYSKVGVWVRKAYEESLRGCLVVCLVPSATDTKWWHTYAVKGEIRFVQRRIKFVGERASAPFPSAIIIFRPPK